MPIVALYHPSPDSPGGYLEIFEVPESYLPQLLETINLEDLEWLQNYFVSRQQINFFRQVET